MMNLLVYRRYVNSTIMFIIFSDFLMFEQIFLSPQVKRNMTITNKLVYTSLLTSCQTTQNLQF